MAAKIFIDGDVGTTGLQVRARLESRRDLTLLRLPEAERKDPQRRAACLNEADLAILCLPDAAAREAASLVENPETRLVDASTAHRVDPDWDYGFAEMDRDQTAVIAASKRVSNPGCYPTGGIAMIRPLVRAGLLPADWPVTIHAVSGYSGGGRKLIESYEDPAAPGYTESPYWLYGLGLTHKHLPEMRLHGLLEHAPLFVPSVGRFAQGMIVQLPLQTWALPGEPSAAALHEVLTEHYRGQQFVTVAPLSQSAGIERLDPERLNGSNDLEIHLFANEAQGQVLICALLDNLGKGASGAAVQNMNLMLGLDPAAGLGAREAA